MCRNIRPLFNFDPPTTEDEIRAAALQYVRKVAGTTKPSKANAAAFDAAVEEIAAITTRLLGELVTTAPPRTREAELARAKARGRQREARIRGRLLDEAEAVVAVDVPAAWGGKPPG